jgi:hypothetical protein
MHYAGEQYATSAHWRYLKAFTDSGEAERMKTESFATILNSPCPAEMLSLWRNDIGIWYRNNPQFFERKDNERSA